MEVYAKSKIRDCQLHQKFVGNREQLLHLVYKMVFPDVPHNRPDIETTKKTVKNKRKIKKQKDKKPLVLVVEDNVDNLLTIKSLLGDDFHIIEAYDGQDGVNKARVHQPDLIFMDIAMPVMNGFRAFDAIRKEKSLQHIPIVAVTASALTADRDEILHYGFDAYISKPIDIERFETILKRFFKEK